MERLTQFKRQYVIIKSLDTDSMICTPPCLFGSCKISLPSPSKSNMIPSRPRCFSWVTFPHRSYGITPFTGSSDFDVTIGFESVGREIPEIGTGGRDGISMYGAGISTLNNRCHATWSKGYIIGNSPKFKIKSNLRLRIFFIRIKFKNYLF